MEVAMKPVCDKCEGHTKGGALFTEWGNVYYLCGLCTAVVQDQPTGGRIQKFINDQLEISDEARGMIEARKRRSQGISAWR